MEPKSVTAAHPGFRAMASFFLRSRGLQAWRLAQDVLHPLPPLPVGKVEDFPYVLTESVSKLQTNADPRERPLMLGKIQNLRLACRRIHNRILGPTGTFSLWRQIGPPWRLRGFAQGREVREGCVIPTFGGGLCQLSGCLLEVALALGLEVVEKHSHTALPADVPTHPRRDATLFWNYVDLRFRSAWPLLFECFLTEASLVVRLRGKRSRLANEQNEVSDVAPNAPLSQAGVQSCFTCTQTDCTRQVTVGLKGAKAAFLLDEYQPEFARFVGGNIKDEDQLLLPFISQGGWGNSFCARRRVECFSWFRFRRSLTLRWAVFRGITVAKAHFELAGILAQLYEKRLSYDVEHICVAQSLLPHIWRSGTLGGRTFDVLMQRLPATLLEQQLNRAAQLYPQSKTLVEFRAPRWFAEGEQEALKCARAIITPHAQIAALYERAVYLPWQTSDPRANGSGTRKDLVVFIGPTLARKGAYAVRELVRETGLSVAVLGPELEEPGFWGGLPVACMSVRELPWDRIHTVVQPALIEYWPRLLLRAHAAGANLVITPQCGLEENQDGGIHHVPFGDVNALSETLTRLLMNNRGGLPCAE